MKSYADICEKGCLYVATTPLFSTGIDVRRAKGIPPVLRKLVLPYYSQLFIKSIISVIEM